MKFKYGADPETFLTLGNKFISAHNILPGTKKDPFKVEKGAVQVDGLAFEYNIDPAETAEEFDKNHAVVQAQMEEMVRKIDKDIKISFVPFATFEVKYFKDLPDDCKILGCDPDFQSGTGNPNLMNEELAHRPYRTAAGHIHIGWTQGKDPTEPNHFEDARFIAQHFYRLGYQPYAGNTRSLTPDEQKRLGWYGHSGAFRPKPYGVELRQYSNLWAEKSESRVRAFNFIHGEMQKLGAA